MNERARKVSSFIRAVIKLPSDLEFAVSSDNNILFCDPYNDEDIIYYAYISYTPPGTESFPFPERLITGVKISLLEQPQLAYDRINLAAAELKEKINGMAR
jgi:hypothetical protein